MQVDVYTCMIKLMLYTTKMVNIRLADLLSSY